MARETQAKVMDGLTFKVQQMGGREASRLFVRISRYLIPSIARAGKVMDKIDFTKGMNQDIDVGNIASGLGEAADFLFEHLDEKEWDYLVDHLLDTCLVYDGKTERLLMQPGVFDEVMAGKVFTQLKLIQFALEVNFKDFWNGPGASIRALAAGAISKLKESSTSSPTGPAGA